MVEPGKSAVIVGGGIAGVMVAWRLRKRGYRVTLIDDARPGRASAAAAGLIDPLSGPRLALADRLETLLPVARELYEQMSRETGLTLFHPMPIVRELPTDDEWASWQSRLDDPEFRALVDSRSSAVKREGWIRGGGWLDFSALLASVERLGVERIREQVEMGGMTYDCNGARWKSRSWDVVIFCTGYARDLSENRELEWRPAAGDSVTIELRGVDEACARVRGIYRIPLGDGKYRVGSTYVWDDFSTEPDPARARVLLDGARKLHGEDPVLLNHTMGIRPIFRNRRPLLGPLPGQRTAFIANGYGSKGSLWAPWAGEHLAGVIEGETPPDPELAPKQGGKPDRLVRLAQDWVGDFLEEGDVAIDATAGNGHDTAFLAHAVGEGGSVVAFDVQDSAVANTRRRLEGEGILERVSLHLASHASVGELMPREAARPVAVAMMNLGFLPGSDRRVITKPEATLRFLYEVLPLMAERSAISLLCYRGHDGGLEEHAAVVEWVNACVMPSATPTSRERARRSQRPAPTRSGWRLQRRTGDSAGSPELFFLWRRSQ